MRFFVGLREYGVRSNPYLIDNIEKKAVNRYNAYAIKHEPILDERTERLYYE